MTPARRTLAVLVAFLAGAVAGGSLVAGLSSRASRQFLAAAQLSLQAQEDHQAAQAWHRGDFGAAVGHAACSVEAMYGSGAVAFDPERVPWSLAFPFVAPVLSRILEPNVTPQGIGNAQAASRAKLGAIWEQLGRVELAEREYGEAARLFGEADAKRMRVLGRELLDQRTPTTPTVR